jgi:exosome complex component MTR3
LANCYVPLPLPTKEADDTAANNSRRRRQDRDHDEIRQVVLETSIISLALGSSLVELGHTKVMCEVHLTTSSDASTSDVGSLQCLVKFAPHIGVDQVIQRSQAVSPIDNTTLSAGKLNQEVAVQESGLSHQLMSALRPVLPLEKYPKCSIVVKVTILQDNGSALSATIMAATLALVDARVELYDLVTSCTVAVMQATGGNQDVDDDDENESNCEYLVDPTQQEMSKADAIICLAMTPNQKEVTLWSQTGRLSADMASQAMNLCRDGCKTYHRFLREMWISKTG